MATGFEQLDVPDFTFLVHNALTEHILFGGAPRSTAILNGALAGTVGLGLRLRPLGLALCAVDHFAAVWPPSVIHSLSKSAVGISVSPVICQCEGGVTMVNLAKDRCSASRLADYLPWVALADADVVLNKDGSFQSTARFHNPDLDSAVASELVPVAGRINNGLRRLGSG